MDDKIEEILAQYPVQIESRKRIRGAILLETREGQYLLREYNGSASRLEREERIKESLMSHGYRKVDKALANKQGELLTRDGSGNIWLMKRWFAGRECDLKDAKQVCRAMSHLAMLHLWMSEQQEDIRTQQTENAEELTSSGRETDLGGEELQAAEVTAFTPIDFFGRRNRELKRVHTYIRKKRRKNEMELALLDAFAHYYEQGCEAEQLETAEHNYDYLQREAAEQGKLMHGSYNYHNLLFQGREVVTSNFENAKVGIQIMDLYGFLRKTMEKNGWKPDLGRRMIASYEEKRPLSEEERHLLYTLLLYPEKYWKQCNFYYNGKKSWMSSKSYEKLLRIRGQEEGRIQFLEMIKDILMLILSVLFEEIFSVMRQNKEYYRYKHE